MVFLEQVLSEFIGHAADAILRRTQHEPNAFVLNKQ